LTKSIVKGLENMIFRLTEQMVFDRIGATENDLPAGMIAGRK